MNAITKQSSLQSDADLLAADDAGDGSALFDPGQLAIAPIFPMAVGLIAGILIDGELGVSPVLSLLVLVLCCTFVLLLRTTTGRRSILLAIASTAAGALLSYSSIRHQPANSVERLAGHEPRLVRLRGVVTSDPVVHEPDRSALGRWGFASTSTSFLLDAQEVLQPGSTHPVQNMVKVSVNASMLELARGDRVTVLGMISSLQPPSNPGGFDWRSFYRRQGVVARVFCKSVQHVSRDGESRTVGLTPLERLRNRVKDWLTSDLVDSAPEEASLLNAMVLGHRSKLDRTINKAFVDAGCAHLLAVSGIHVGFAMAFAYGVGRLLLLGRRGSMLLVAATVILFGIVCEPRPPVLRAVIMAVLFCAAMLLRRRGGHLNWISAAAVILLILDPDTVYDVGFQLSFVAVLGVIYLSPKLLLLGHAVRSWIDRALLNRPFAGEDRVIARIADGRADERFWVRWGAAQRVPYAIKSALAVACGAWLATWPIVTVYFGRVHPWGMINTLIALPFAAVVELLGFARLFASAVLPSFGAALQMPLRLATELLMNVVEVLSRLPGAEITCTRPPAWLVGGYYTALVIAVLSIRPRPEVERRGSRYAPVEPTVKRAALFTCATTAAVAGVLMWSLQQAYHFPRESMHVAVLAVGAGSATVIELPDRSVLICDAGSTGSYDVAEHAVIPFLQSAGIRRVDHVHVTHANLDHYAAVPGLLAKLPIQSVSVNRYFSNGGRRSGAVGRFYELTEAAGKRVHILADDVRSWVRGGVSFEVLWPPSESDQTLEPNDSSTVLRLTYRGRSILLTGDIEEYAQQRLLERGGLHADVLVLPHHGSVTPTLPAFIKAVDPRLAVQSSHRRNENQDDLLFVLGRIPLFNTAEDGAVLIEMAGGNLRVRGYKSGREAVLLRE